MGKFLTRTRSGILSLRPCCIFSWNSILIYSEYLNIIQTVPSLCFPWRNVLSHLCISLGWFLSQFWRDCFFLVLVAPEHKLDDCLTSPTRDNGLFPTLLCEKTTSFLGLIGFEKLVVMKSRDQNKEQKQNMWKTWKVELTSYKNMMNWQFDTAKPL